MNSTTRPEWMDAQKPSLVLDARPMLATGQHPLSLVLENLAQMTDGQILLLITPFKPQPLHDKVLQAGHSVFVEHINDNEVHTFIKK